MPANVNALALYPSIKRGWEDVMIDEYGRRDVIREVNMVTVDAGSSFIHSTGISKSGICYEAPAWALFGPHGDSYIMATSGKLSGCQI